MAFWIGKKGGVGKAGKEAVIVIKGRDEQAWERDFTVSRVRQWPHFRDI